MKFPLLVVVVLLLAACKPAMLVTYDGKVFTAHGWRGGAPAGGWQRVFAIYAGDDPDVPPMAGKYEQHWGTITFTPAFAPAPLIPMRAVFHTPSGEIRSAIFHGPPPPADGPPVSVSAVWPSAAEWPANTLKIYLQFSGPMSRGVAYDHVRLLNADGSVVVKPFVEIDQELWSPDMTRLTINFDPGRIKTGMKDNIAAGLPLIPGRKYTLVVDKDFPDARGRPLTGEMRKAITAVPAVRLPVDPATWRLTPPKTPADPLVIDFPRPMDHALALRVITVEGISGQAKLENDDRRWVFTPAHPWPRGAFVVRVDKTLEDLAGNRLHQLFDMDLTDQSQLKPPPPYDRIGFEVE